MVDGNGRGLPLWAGGVGLNRVCSRGPLACATMVGRLCSMKDALLACSVLDTESKALIEMGARFARGSWKVAIGFGWR